MSAAEWMVIPVLFCGVSAIAWSLRAAKRREQALNLLGASTGVSPLTANRLVDTFPPRWRWVGPVTGVAIALLIWGVAGLPTPFAAAFGLLAGVLAMLVEEYWAHHRLALMEQQLVDAIDLMISSLRAGTALLVALEVAWTESRRPMRPELEAVVGRIRLGEDPRDVIRHFSQRVPQESFRLFTHALLVNWETGGSLAGTLLTISRTIRDRIEVGRRVRAQAVESQVSVLSLMVITYGICILMFRTNPEPLRNFLLSSIGTWLAAATIVLQAVGILWIWRMSQIRF